MNPSRTIAFGRPWIGDEERQAVQEVLCGNILTHGPRCRAFEERFAHWLGQGARCVSMSSCMAALHMAWIGLEIGPGDEVVTPAMTHVATAHAVMAVGARPVFVDADPATGNITAEAVEKALSPRTRAVTLVHFLGIPCDMESIMALARDRGLAVVEDCALAVGARFNGVHVGLWGDAGCFSFYPVKHITTAEGGMLSCKSEELAARIARKRAFGVDRSHAERSEPGVYDVVDLGLNYRMSELQAALGLVQMDRLPEILRRREENFSRLKAGLSGLEHVRVLDATDPRAESAHYCLVMVLEGPLATKRSAVARDLGEAGVGTSVYYPQPVPRMRYYQGLAPYARERYPVAEAISDCGVALPVGPHLGPDDMDYVADRVVAVVRQHL